MSDPFSQEFAIEIANLGKYENVDIKYHLDFLKEVQLLMVDETGDRFQMHQQVRDIALGYLKFSEDYYLGIAGYCDNVIENIATLSTKGEDGLLLSLMIYDEKKKRNRSTQNASGY